MAGKKKQKPAFPLIAVAMAVALLAVAIGLAYFLLPRPGAESQSPDETSNSSPEDLGTYLACGCGCCGGAENSPAKCVTRAELDRIILEDKLLSKSPSCKLMGCSIGTAYRVC